MDERTVAPSPPIGSPTPTSRRKVLYESQKRALAELMAGMDDDARWLLLIGPEGIGKRTVLQALLAQLELTNADVVICDGSETREAGDLMSALRRQLQLPPPGRSLLGRRHSAADIAASRQATNKPLAVLIENAHQQSSGSLRLLAELTAAGSPAGVWVVLAGTPRLEEPALRACGKAKGVRCKLTPLTSSEVAHYIERRIRDGADKLPSFSGEAIARIAAYTRGTPGLINTLCDTVAGWPSARVTNHVSPETVEEAAELLGLTPSFERTARARPDSVFSDAEPEELGDIDPEDEDAADERRERRRWLGIFLLAGVLVGAAGLILYAEPLTTLARTTLDRLTAGSAAAPEALRGSSGSEGGGRARQPRRESPSPVRTTRGTPAEVTPGGQGSQRRPAAPDRGEKTARPERVPPPAPSPEQVAALIAGAREGRAADVASLLASGLSPNVRDVRGITPLMQAVEHGHVPAMGVLLDRGAQINASNRGGITPAMLAVINERTEALRLLLGRGADVNARSGAGWTALTFAAWKGDPELVRVLLRHGATPNVVDKQGWTPLDYATAQLRSPSTDIERLPVDTDLPVMTRGTRHAEVIPLLQGGAGR